MDQHGRIAPPQSQADSAKEAWKQEIWREQNSNPLQRVHFCEINSSFPRYLVFQGQSCHIGGRVMLGVL